MDEMVESPAARLRKLPHGEWLRCDSIEQNGLHVRVQLDTQSVTAGLDPPALIEIDGDRALYWAEVQGTEGAVIYARIQHRIDLERLLWIDAEWPVENRAAAGSGPG
jgi:hypothetical protein